MADWEMRIVRKSEQKRASDGKRRTVGTYQIFHGDEAQTGFGMKGMVAETRGPGANAPAGNNRRVEAGRYPLSTQDGTNYDTIGYKESESTSAKPKPGIELNNTGKRSEILVHPGQGFLSSIGCINPCTSLPNAAEPIDYVGSRKRVIAIIEDMKTFLGDRLPEEERQEDPACLRGDRGRAGVRRLTGRTDARRTRLRGAIARRRHPSARRVDGCASRPIRRTPCGRSAPPRSRSACCSGSGLPSRTRPSRP